MVTLTELILETFGLTKAFLGFTAVKDVNLQVRRGAIHALIGPNGAGKTTVFNLLTKFLPPSAGRIQFNGRDITRVKPAEVARLGMVRSFQISAVFPHMSVRDNVRVALQRPLGTSQRWLLAQLSSLAHAGALGRQAPVWTRQTSGTEQSRSV